MLMSAVQGPVFMGIQSFASDRTEARSRLFTEQEAFWNLPLHETSAIVDVAVVKGLVFLCFHCLPLLSLSSSAFIVFLCIHCLPLLSLSSSAFIVFLCFHCLPLLLLSSLPLLSLSSSALIVFLCLHCLSLLSLSFSAFAVFCI